MLRNDAYGLCKFAKAVETRRICSSTSTLEGIFNSREYIVAGGIGMRAIHRRLLRAAEPPLFLFWTQTLEPLAVSLLLTRQLAWPGLYLFVSLSLFPSVSPLSSFPPRVFRRYRSCKFASTDKTRDISIDFPHKHQSSERPPSTRWEPHRTDSREGAKTQRGDGRVAPRNARFGRQLLRRSRLCPSHHVRALGSGAYLILPRDWLGLRSTPLTMECPGAPGIHHRFVFAALAAFFPALRRPLSPTLLLVSVSPSLCLRAPPLASRPHAREARGHHHVGEGTRCLLLYGLHHAERDGYYTAARQRLGLLKEHLLLRATASSR
jgi:hypothetical protein